LKLKTFQNFSKNFEGVGGPLRKRPPPPASPDSLKIPRGDYSRNVFGSRARRFMKNRSSVEIIVIIFTVLVAMVILTFSIGLIVVEITNPATDTTILTSTLMSLTSAILGTIFGMLMNKSEKLNKRPEDKED
jgi:hypothetical protein